MDGMKAVRLPRDRPHRTRVPQDRVRRQRHRSREPGYPRKSNLPGIQEIAWLVRDPCPQQSASSDPPANHSRDSHETRRFYTVWVILGKRRQEADAPRALALLRARCKRPRRRAAEQRDEQAPPHSITSSSSASPVGGIARPSALAVLRLRTISNLVGCWTGRSAGFSPLRTRPI